MDWLDNYIRLDTLIMTLCCFWTAFVMFRFYKLISNVGSYIMKGYFLTFATFLIAISLYTLIPNIHTLLIATYVSICGSLLAAYMYRYIYRYYKKTGNEVLPKVFKDLAIFNMLAQTTLISNNEPKKITLTDKYSKEKIQRISWRELLAAPKNEPFYLDKDKKVVTEIKNFDFAGIFAVTKAESGGTILGHFHNCDEVCKVVRGDVTLRVIIGNETTRLMRFVQGDVFPVREGTIHEVTTDNGYELNVYFIPPEL